MTCVRLVEQNRMKGVQFESTTVLWDNKRIYPTLIKNPAGYLVEGTTVENDDLEWLSLEPLSTDEYKCHFSHIILKDLDLTDFEGLSDAAEANCVWRRF